LRINIAPRHYRPATKPNNPASLEAKLCSDGSLALIFAVKDAELRNILDFDAWLRTRWCTEESDYPDCGALGHAGQPSSEGRRDIKLDQHTDFSIASFLVTIFRARPVYSVLSFSVGFRSFTRLPLRLR
jgi:hypothetical protein